ncbi:MAG: hypothetical protein AAF317_15250, partial [Pseudomonadota bacterium]
RFPVRLQGSISEDQDHETLLSLIEFQNGLNCLSARQVRDFAWAFGQALLRLEDYLTLSPADRDAFFNLALLSVDQAKFAGMSPLHQWLRTHGAELRDRMVAANEPLYLYDYMTGHLVGMTGDPLRAFGIEQVLDPANIGMGSCSFLEMEGNGLNTGSHACARNLGCAASDPLSVEDLGGVVPGRDATPDGRIILDHELRRTGDLQLDRRDLTDLQLIGALRTPFGTPIADLRPDVCENGVNTGIGGLGTAGFGSGQGDARTGIGLAAFGNSNWVGCVAATTIANRNKGDWATCQMNVAWNAANGAYDEDYRTGGGIRAFGASGHGSCSDPLAQGGSQSGEDDGYTPYLSDPTEAKAAFAKAKSNIAEASGEDGLARLLLGEFFDRYIDASIVAAAFSPDLSPEHREQAVAAYEGVRADKDNILDAAFETIEDAQEGYVNGNFAETNTEKGVNGEITVDLDKHSSSSTLEGTLLHEAMHVIKKLIFAGARNNFFALTLAPSLDEHDLIYEMEGTSSNVVSDYFTDRAKKSYNDNNDVNDAMNNLDCLDAVSCAEAAGQSNAKDQGDGGAGDQLPAGPQLCGAQQAMMRDMMSCTSVGQFGGSGTGGIDPVASGGGTSDAAVVDPGRVLPTLEQWTNAQSNVFTQCMAKYGIGTAGTDENGFVIAGINEPSSSTGCGVMICPPGGTAAAVGAGCACSGRNGELGRPYGNEKLCFTSDACLPGKPEVFIVVTQPDTSSPALANPEFDSPGMNGAD